MAKAMTEKQYFNRVKDLADEVKDRVKDYNEDPHDVLNEVVDGTDLVIYTRKNLDVLRFTDNLDAVEDFGFSEFNSMGQFLAAAAFASLQADVAERLSRDDDFEF